LGANCYLTKPFNVSAYREMAKQLYEFWLELAKLPPSGADLPTTGSSVQ
jgi:hypothetical protein